MSGDIVVQWSKLRPRHRLQSAFRPQRHWRHLVDTQLQRFHSGPTPFQPRAAKRKPVCFTAISRADNSALDRCTKLRHSCVNRSEIAKKFSFLQNLPDLPLKFYKRSKTAKFWAILTRFYQPQSRLDGDILKRCNFFKRRNKPDLRNWLSYLFPPNLVQIYQLWDSVA